MPKFAEMQRSLQSREDAAIAAEEAAKQAAAEENEENSDDGSDDSDGSGTPEDSSRGVSSRDIELARPRLGPETKQSARSREEQERETRRRARRM